MHFYKIFKMKAETLELLVKQSRARLVEYRFSFRDDEPSIHINAYEIAICLVEFSLNTNPHRQISIEEEQWFKAGRYIDLILGNSEWSDLSDLYYRILDEVKRLNYFRN